MITIATFVVSLFAPAPATMPCALVNPTTATELLGARPGLPQLSPDEPDDDIPGATRTTCLYMAGSRMLLIMEHTFKDAKAARDAMTEEAIRARHEDEAGFIVKDEPGLGDKAYWVVLKTGAEYVVIKGARVLSIALGGVARTPAEFQAQLRAATKAALAGF